MGKVGFPDKNIVRRMFDVFDLDGGGEIDFEECCIGLSYIMPRDNHHVPLEKHDMKFYEICFNLLDTDGDGVISMFEFFNVVQSAARLGPQKALSITQFIFRTLDPLNKGVDYSLFVFKVSSTLNHSTQSLVFTLSRVHGVNIQTTSKEC